MSSDSSPDGSDRLPIVSEVELDCIRLAGTGASSKVIARQLGLSHNTVNVYASRVRRILGAGDRYEAALLLRRHDAGEDLKKFKLNAELLEANTRKVNPDKAFSAPPEMAIGSFLREDRAEFDLTIPAGNPDPLTQFGSWGRDNALSSGQRLWWIARTTVLVILATFLAFAAVQSLDATLTKLGFIN
ncbi:MAG: LuxR C-terminal-related transcriptional regulator [Sphingomonas sp.]|uniref:response regulator transcription factor n=1 Tax=Sphingomonas sp. TaxID=28214 RepID=UPI002603A4E6|nr:LuxR C-terminal-related transcriptional regulator [Sphingomonas sp.]MDK2768463.1 LuxR C-terminal-related transcriptional regulator [Sphingomonas sp.]